jgi:hypothetical protein
MTGSEEDFQRVDRMLGELMVKHLEMAQLCGDYREIIDGVRERPWDTDARNLARNLPGARYHVSATFAREHAQRIESELRVLFEGRSSESA